MRITATYLYKNQAITFLAVLAVVSWTTFKRQRYEIHDILLRNRPRSTYYATSDVSRKHARCSFPVDLVRHGIKKCSRLNITTSAYRGVYDISWNICSQSSNVTVRINNRTSMSVLVVLGRKCMLAASRASTWWVTLSMRRALS